MNVMFQREMNRKLKIYDGESITRQNDYLLFQANNWIHEMKLIPDLTDKLKGIDKYQHIVAYFRNWYDPDENERGKWKMIEVNYFLKGDEMICFKAYLGVGEIKIGWDLIDTNTNVSAETVKMDWVRFIRVRESVIEYITKLNRYRLLHETGVLKIRKFE